MLAKEYILYAVHKIFHAGMNKATASKVNEEADFCKSTFTVTFAVEILGMDVWHDCDEGWLDLGPCLQGLKIQYQLYPGHVYDLDVLIWPHVAKIWCGIQYGWVRTWQFLERRWLAFTIRHIFPVRVTEMRNHIATVTPTSGLGVISTNYYCKNNGRNIKRIEGVTGFVVCGLSAKNDKNTEAFLPYMKFGDRRYFAPVIEKEENIESNIQKLIWNAVEAFIPSSYLDGEYDVPDRVTDIRHQDAVLYHVRETILNSTIQVEVEESLTEIEQFKTRDRRDSKAPKEKEKKKIAEVPKQKFEIKLSGDSILAGAGRIMSFEKLGDRPIDLGEIIALISTNNLPAQDDLPLIFINIENVTDLPVEDLMKARISQVYTRWKVGNEEHNSQLQNVKLNKTVTFKDYHAVPLQYTAVPEVTATYLDNPLEIELRGKKSSRLDNCNPVLFGYNQGDRNFDRAVPKRTVSEPQDVLLAVTKINARPLTKGNNVLVTGEFPLYPPSLLTTKLGRDCVCTNDINGIRMRLKPDIVIQPAVILQAQMTMDLSVGLVGCKAKKLKTSFSRLYCLAYNTDTIVAILDEIKAINAELRTLGNTDDLITGFALDTGDVVIIYIEGLRDGRILRVWELLEDFHNKIKSVFSSSNMYSTRLYPDMVTAMVPFQVTKMFAPLGVVLACPSVYARPTLPFPTKSALLKIGRLVAGRLRVAPSRADMPSSMELMSFRLELCVPRRTSAVVTDEGLSLFTPEPSQNITSSEYWKMNGKII